MKVYEFLGGLGVCGVILMMVSGIGTETRLSQDDGISETAVDLVIDWTTLQPGQIVEFTLPGGWWHEGAFEASELPLMKSGDTRYVAYVAKVEPFEGIWLAVSMTSTLPVEFRQVLTVPAALASSVTFTLQQPVP